MSLKPTEARKKAGRQTCKPTMNAGKPCTALHLVGLAVRCAQASRLSHARALESHNHSISSRLRQIPYVGSIRAALPAGSETRSGSRASMRKPCRHGCLRHPGSVKTLCPSDHPKKP